MGRLMGRLVGRLLGPQIDWGGKKSAGILRSRPIRSELDSASDQNSYSAEIRIERGAE